MPLIAFKWSDDSIAELRKLWCEQGASASVAAQLLSEKFGGYVTRSSILGKVKRLGLAHSKGNPAITRRQKKARRVVKESLTTHSDQIVQKPAQLPPCLPVAFEPVEQPPEADQQGLPCIGLLDLRETTCRFPIGDPRHEGFGYCGAPSPVGKPYCDHHHRIAYMQNQPPVSRNKNGDHHGMRVVQLTAY